MTGAGATAEEKAFEPEEEEIEVWGIDDVNGEVLNAAKVRQARRAYIEYCERMKIGEVRPIQEAVEATGSSPVSVCCIDLYKGDGAYRSRLVARQFRGDADPLYAATPPLAVRGRGAETNYKLGVLDVRRALSKHPATCLHTSHCHQNCRTKYPGCCWKLNKAMYGTRAALQAWQKEYTSTFPEWGFVRNRSFT